MGADWARRFTTEHETIAGNLPADEAVDHDNNRVGRRIAIEAGPGVSSEELGGRVEQAVREGRLVVVGRDGLTLEFTDQITPAEVSGARPFRRPLPGQPQPPW